jgi:hypothetical protein
MEAKRFYCHACRTGLELERPPGRRDECKACSAELHVCRNCTFFDARMSRGCREPQADEVRDLDRANFCGFFLFREGRPESADDRPEQAKAAFDALFRGGKKAEPEADPAKDAFNKLFKR